jgi:transaldolase
MKATRMLHEVGKSLWLDNISRELLDSGTLKRYIDELSVTGLTSNPTIFDHAIKNSTSYDAAIRQKVKEGKTASGCSLNWPWKTSPERPISSADLGPDRRRGWLAIPDAAVLPRTLPGGGRGFHAGDRATHSGRPQSQRQLGRLGVCEPLGRGRGEQGADLTRNQLGIAIAKRTYKAARDLLSSPRWRRAYNAGARPQRPLWASTGTKDPQGSDVFYVKALAAPFTVNTMPKATLKALADHGESAGPCRPTAATAKRCWRSSPRPVSTSTLWPPSSRTLGGSPSWSDLMEVLVSKSADLRKAS